MTRVFNFSPGPAALPESVLRQAADELVDWRGTGMSVMEMSHRSEEFIGIAKEAEQLLREIMAIPQNYKVLFMQGGAIAEMAIVPLNMYGDKASADYIDTGEWSKKAIKEAQKYGKVNVAASSKDTSYTSIPPRSEWKLDPDAAYVHICSNETIGGVEYQSVPSVGDVPLVADMSSNILSRQVDVSKYGLIYAGAQKNIGPAGLTIVIIRDDLLGRSQPATPSAFDYKIVADNESMYNTPPTYAIYMAGLVFHWIKNQGGLQGVEAHNRAKAAVLYDYLDTTSFYNCPVARDCRSLMNVPFRLKDEKLDSAFLAGAKEAGMVQLKGHRVVGGMRASIYNAMPIEGVKALVAYMREFERRHG